MNRLGKGRSGYQLLDIDDRTEVPSNKRLVCFKKRFYFPGKGEVLFLGILNWNVPAVLRQDRNSTKREQNGEQQYSLVQMRIG